MISRGKGKEAVTTSSDVGNAFRILLVFGVIVRIEFGLIWSI